MNQKELSYSSFYKKWSFVMSILNILGLAFSIWNTNYILWVGLVTLLFSFYLYKMVLCLPKFPLYIGYANWVSLIRLCIILLSFTFYRQTNDFYLFILFLIAISFDGLDGYLARKHNQTSEAGGNFDMEIDAFLVLVLSFIHFYEHRLSWLILIPGSLRYTYELLLFWLPKSNREILPKKVRATIAVSFFLSLLIPFITQEYYLIMITYLSGTLIVCSFLFSFYSQLNTNK